MNLRRPLRRADDPQQPYRMRRGMYILPSLFTAGNIAAGYYAISQAIQGSAILPFHFDNAAKAIGFAVVFDGLDGRIARMTNTTSDFGRELDSLADVITFGVAPAILAWLWGCHQLPELWQPDLRRKVIDKMLAEGGWVVNDMERTLGGRRTFVVVAESATPDGAHIAWVFYFTEFNGQVYGLVTNTRADQAAALAAAAEQFVAALNERTNNAMTASRSQR